MDNMPCLFSAGQAFQAAFAEFARSPRCTKKTAHFLAGGKKNG
jgi:hypothetical protein